MAFKKNIIEEKNMPDVSGHNGMQKLIEIDCISTQKSLDLINIYLANNWKILRFKKHNSSLIAVIEYHED